MTTTHGTEAMEARERAVTHRDSATLESKRHIVLTSANKIQMKPVFWLWQDRIPLNELTLFAGREGIGKSTVTFELVAWVTSGTMRGRYLGTPKAVIIAATEDSWEHTIVPRLVGAGADLSRVYRCDVMTSDGTHGSLTLPSDIGQLEAVVEERDVALMVLDPLMSRLSASLDSHRDAEVRLALEPLTDFAKRVGIAIIGLIHVNKSAGKDSLNLVMGSRAFTSVARAVLMAMKDPEQEGKFIFGLEKSNLGPIDAASPYSYAITSKVVGHYGGEEIRAGVVNWLGKSDKSVSDAMDLVGDGESVTATGEAVMWLEDHLSSPSTLRSSADIKLAARKAGHSESAIARARKRLNVQVTTEGFPRTSSWALPKGRKIETSSASVLREQDQWSPF